MARRPGGGDAPARDAALDRWTGHRACCAICAAPGEDVRAHHLTHGVSVRLCRDHRSSRFQGQNAGQDFADALAAVWTTSGCLTASRRQALDAHARRARTRSPVTRPRPGSYSWPALRAEAERRWAGGEAPLPVMQELRSRHGGDTAVVPSMRTMRRWHTQARWLDPPPLTDPPNLRERTLAWIAEANRDTRRLVGSEPFPGWPSEDRWGRPYRRR